MIFSRKNYLPRRPIAPRYFLTKAFNLKLIIALILIFFLIVSVIPIYTYFIILDGETGQIIYKKKIEVDEQFAIKYIHSIHLTPVLEQYQINSDYMIVLNEVQFNTYSVGMPSELNEGEKIKLEDGKFIIENMKRELPVIDLRLGQVIANHQLFIDDKSFELSKIAPPGSWIRITVSKLNIFEVWGVANEA